MPTSSGGWGGGGSTAGPYTFDFYGYREFVNMLIAFLKFYERHAIAINAVLPAEVVAALTTLVGINDLLTWNEPGPA